MTRPHGILSLALFAIAVAIAIDAWVRWKKPARPATDRPPASLVIQHDPNLPSPAFQEGSDRSAVFTFKNADDAKEASLQAFKGAATVYRNAFKSER
jgi:hypothetical protein